MMQGGSCRPILQSICRHGAAGSVVQQARRSSCYYYSLRVCGKGPSRRLVGGRWMMAGSSAVASCGLMVGYYWHTSSHEMMSKTSMESLMMEDADEEEQLQASSSSSSSSSSSREERHGVSRWWFGVWDVICVTWRLTEVSLRLSPSLVLFPISSEWAWAYIRYSLEQLGPVFVKLAQWASTRLDLFPPSLCQQLAPLQHKAYHHRSRHDDVNHRHLHRILKQTFGANYSQILQIEQVIGSGCIASVYRGTYRDNDNDNQQHIPVAIKVLHPNIHQRMERDVKLLRRIASILHNSICPLLHLPRAVDNFAQHLQGQMNLSTEAHHLQQFHTNFQNSTTVSFPRPLHHTPDLLIQTYISSKNAKPISNYYNNNNNTHHHSDDNNNHIHKQQHDLATSLVGAFFKMIFVDNFVHCDLHPGNILVFEHNNNNNNHVKNDNNKNNKQQYEIVLLDTGMAHSLKSNDLKNLRDLFKAVISNDGETAGRLMMERAKYIRPHLDEKESFAKSIGMIVREFHEKKNLNFGTIQVGVLLNRVLDQCRLFGVEIDPAMANIVLSTLVLEGVGRSLQPQLNLMDFAVPFILGKQG